MTGSGQDKLQALIDDLEQSIASFDERFSKIPVDDAPPPTPAPAPAKKHFPEIDPDARRNFNNDRAAATAPTPAGAPLTSLLSELAASAEREAEHVLVERERRRQAAQRIDRALRLAADYLDQLTQHLNLLKPELPLTYAVDRLHQFAGIHWQDSSTRHETDSHSERALFEKLVLRVRLTCQPLALLVPDGAMRRAENELYLMNLAWHDAGIVELPGRGIGHRLEVDGSIPVQLVFAADIDQDRIVLRCRNLLGLGLSAYSVAPEAIDSAVMDTLGRCLLGRSKRLPDAFTPIAFNTPESTT